MDYQVSLYRACEMLGVFAKAFKANSPMGS